MPTLPLLGACLALAVPVQETEVPAAPALELEDHVRLSARILALSEAHPGLVQRLELGRSRAGRTIEALRLAGAGAAEDRARPAILLVANVDGARVFASAVALHHATALAEGYAGDERVRTLLDTTTVYVVPRANPDAAEARFETPRRERRASGPGVDDDRDGRQGEDPSLDLDGDGVVTWIRVEDPDGEWRADPSDPRALARAERVKGEPGVYRLWPEGRDADGDERVAEDEALDARVDRNFPAGWNEHGPEAGVFPTDEPETRALCDFVLLHPEIALVVLYDAQDTLVAEIKGVGDEAPPVKRVPPAGVLESDAKLLGELGKRYRKATEAKAKAEGDDKGTFGRWCYEHRGLLVLATPLWDIPLEEARKDEAQKKDAPKEGTEKPRAEKPRAEAGESKPDGAAELETAPREEKGERGKKDDEPKPSDDAKRLAWIDAAGPEEGWRFVAWRPFQHPELGPVEIGGFAPHARLEPPPARGGELAQAHLDWFLSLGALLPRVSLAECTRERLGEGVHRVTAVLQNDAYLPLFTRSGRRTETGRPAKVRLLLPEAGQRLGGPVQEFVEDLPGSGGRAEFTWLVQGPDAMEIAVSVETTHAGTATRVAQAKTRKEQR